LLCLGGGGGKAKPGEAAAKPGALAAKPGALAAKPGALAAARDAEPGEKIGADKKADLGGEPGGVVPKPCLYLAIAPVAPVTLFFWETFFVSFSSLDFLAGALCWRCLRMSTNGAIAILACSAIAGSILRTASKATPMERSFSSMETPGFAIIPLT